MFPNSKIAKNFKCRCTEITSIFNEAIYPSLRSNLVNYMAQNLLSVINDGSNESGISKMNPVCIFIFDCEGSNQVEFKFYTTY